MVRRRNPGRTPRRAPRGEDGTATLEMIGIIPMAVLIAGAIIQLYMLGYAGVQAESAARVAAREASLGASTGAASTAGEDSVNQRFDPDVRPVSVASAGDEPSVEPAPAVDEAVTYRAVLRVPFLGIGVDDLDIEVTRYVVMPEIG
jgi:hypothetical protein